MLSKKIDKKIELTNNVYDSSHIIYTFSNMDQYLENAFAFMTEGLDKNEIVVHIGVPAHNQLMKERLDEAGYSQSQINRIVFYEINEVYGTDKCFDLNDVNDKAEEIYGPYLQDKRMIRTWSQVQWKEQDPQVLCPKLSIYEKGQDDIITERGNLISVCAYDAKTMPSHLLNDLLQSHEYHMTDTHLSRSHLYQKLPRKMESICKQMKLDTTVEKEKIRSEKLSMAGGIATNIAHELHNCLASMSGALQLMKAKNQIDATNENYFNIFDRQMEKVEHLASEYLTLAQPHTENRQAFNIIQLMTDVMENMYAQANKKKISLHTQTDNQDIKILCDKEKLKQVFSKIIQNAIEAMEAGTIVIDVRSFVDDVHVYVTDDGPGIPEDILSQLGEPFMTTKENGTGLGLLIAEKITRDHGGKLNIESKVGMGTTCTITLPKL